MALSSIIFNINTQCPLFVIGDIEKKYDQYFIWHMCLSLSYYPRSSKSEDPFADFYIVSSYDSSIDIAENKYDGISGSANFLELVIGKM